MTWSSWAVALGVLLVNLACGNVVAIRIPKTDPHPQAFYTCEPAGTDYKCESAQSLHQYDSRLEPSAEKCENGIHQVHVQTNWHGGVSRIQYQCALPGPGGFPAVPPSAPATAAAGGQPGSP
jgi:hypothetical protein